MKVLFNRSGKGRITMANTSLLRVRTSAEDKLIKGKLDFKHLQEMHRYIFQDIYEWAGKSSKK